MFLECKLAQMQPEAGNDTSTIKKSLWFGGAFSYARGARKMGTVLQLLQERKKSLNLATALTTEVLICIIRNF